jgi:hypothetical protein
MKCTAVFPLIAAILVMPAATQARQRQTAGSGSPRVRTLMLVPAPIDAAKSYSLLPRAGELTSGDAVPLYTKAAQALPGNLDQQQIHGWLRLPLDKLPQAEAQRVVQQAQTSLQQIELATRCQDCDWPPFTPGTMPAHLKEYRALAQLLCLQARLQMIENHCDDAVGSMQTSLAMARHVGESPTLIQGMVGVAMAAQALRNVEDIAQVEGGPNLHGALEALPRPLVDMEKPIASELNSLATNPQYNVLVRVAMRRQLKESHARVRQLMHRLDRDVAALQCIEALRHYAATHDGQLPKQMTDITDITVPKNPETQKPFGYRLDGSKAILDAAAPQGGQPRDALRYEITLAP